nr:putative pentatricopeptide repeat-containing protein At1g74400 [Quercus suber]XP_023873796.1 putative pentatricopeptide repeat-containing protein At1g74400 [Quercus suber]
MTHIMRYMKRFPLVQTRVTKLFAIICHPKVQLHTYLKPPKANQALKKYLNSNCITEALMFFRELMRKSPSTIDSFSFLFVLKACTQKHSATGGKQLHTLIIKFGFEPIIYLQTSLINMYSARGNLFDAHCVFDEITCKNIVCWTALISAYVDNQNPQKALKLVWQMQMDNLEPDNVMLTVALSACADIGALEMGEWIHAYIRCKEGLHIDLSLNNSLINMYAKCGDIVAARRLFDSMKKKDVTTWTSMIVGHALHGQAEEALKLFSKMRGINKNSRKHKGHGDCGSSLIVPNDVTFIGVLMACSHAGIVEEGKQHFKSMSEDYGLKPRESHFGCMVDLFCRAGLLNEAYEFILEMPFKPNAVVWRTLLGACTLKGNIEVATEVQVRLLELDPGYAGDYVAMSNIYASKGMWDQKIVVRHHIKRQRSPGCSLIEVGTEINEFVAADEDHPLRSEIYTVLKHLLINMKSFGYSLELSSTTKY